MAVKGERSESRSDTEGALDGQHGDQTIKRRGGRNPPGKRKKMIVRNLMTIEEVADHLRVSVPTVRWLRQEGRFAPAIHIGRRLVWDRVELLDWVERNRESSRLTA